MIRSPIMLVSIILEGYSQVYRRSVMVMNKSMLRLIYPLCWCENYSTNLAWGLEIKYYHNTEVINMQGCVSGGCWVIKKTWNALYFSHIQGYDIHGRNVLFFMDVNFPYLSCFLEVYNHFPRNFPHIYISGTVLDRFLCIFWYFLYYFVAK